MPPVFLSLDEVIAIHRDQLDRYGGAEGIRDITLLQSALAMPQAGFGGQYLHRDTCEMAAAYLFHLVKNHPFVDGNKRVGAVAAVVFMALNDLALKAPVSEFEALVLAVARGQADKQVIAQFFREHVS